MLLDLSRKGGVRWGRACGCVGDRRSVYTVCRENLKARDYWEWKTLVLSRHMDWIDLAQELDNEPFGSIICREFLS
jgi:hypothetical protein